MQNSQAAQFKYQAIIKHLDIVGKGTCNRLHGLHEGRREHNMCGVHQEHQVGAMQLPN